MKIDIALKGLILGHIHHANEKIIVENLIEAVIIVLYRDLIKEEVKGDQRIMKGKIIIVNIDEMIEIVVQAEEKIEILLQIQDQNLQVLPIQKNLLQKVLILQGVALLPHLEVIPLIHLQVFKIANR